MRAANMYEDVSAMLNNERAFVARTKTMFFALTMQRCTNFVQCCMVNAKNIVFVRRMGKTPFILFGGIGEKRINGNVEKRTTYVDESLIQVRRAFLHIAVDALDLVVSVLHWTQLGGRRQQ